MPKRRSRKERTTTPVSQTLWWLVSLALLVSLVVWLQYSHVRSLSERQALASQLVARLVASELNSELTSLRQTNAMLLREAYGQAHRLGGDDSDMARLLARRLRLSSPHWQGLAIADTTGVPQLTISPSPLPDGSPLSLRAFAAGGASHRQSLVVDDGHPQIELAQRVTLGDGGTRLLLTRYDADILAGLLAHGAAADTDLLLSTDDSSPSPVVMTLMADERHIAARLPVTTTEQARVAQWGAIIPVSGSAWQLVALPDGRRLVQARQIAWQWGAAIGALALVLGLGGLLRMRRETTRRVDAEAALRQEQAGLERKVRRRTRALSHANAELTAQVERRRKAERRMIMLTRAVEHTGDSIIVTDRQGIIAYANPAFVRLTGRPAGDVVGTSLADLQTAHQPSEFMRRLWSHLEREEAFREIFCIRNAEGQPCYTEQTISPLRNSKGEITRLIATGKDITERMDSEKRLSYLAHHDTLTGLPNRALMFDRLEHALARANRRSTQVALLFMDIDRFKTINDSLGHQAGDELLKAVAERLGRSVRRSDSIARLGGDEFVAILEDIHHTDEPVHVANTILAAIAKPLTLTGHEVSVTSSMGIALFPEDGGDPNMLLQCADAAMYKAKAQGGNAYNFYTADMTADAQRRLHLESRLRNALDNGEFRLLYQPRLALHEGRITAVEALLRWQPEDDALQSPADFMQILEETGLIRPVGEWILQQVCADFVRLQQAGHELRIACNLSAKQFRDVELVEIIDRTVLDQAMRPQDLELELTESLLAEDADHAADMLQALRDRGVRISVDDFGTGYSSLGYLKRFPIDNLKIDQSFVRQLNADKDDAAIVSAVIALAHSLGLGAVAEGVETQAQLQTLGLLGCDEVQGMLLSEPLAMDDLLVWLDNR